MKRSLVMAASAIIVSASLAPAAAAASIVHGFGFSSVIGLSRPASTSINWAGYATFKDGTRFTDVKGTWIQPSATCSDQAAYASFWIGIDGYNSSTVEQIGTDADCVSGSPTNYAWYEMYPKFPVFINMKISAGDLLTSEVSSRGTTFKLTMTDATTGQSFKTKQTSTSATRSSAEWVVEASWGGHDFLPLTNFGTVQFSGSYTTGSGHTGSISDAAWSNDEITMAASAAVAKAVPSALSPDGTAFSVTWTHA